MSLADQYTRHIPEYYPYMYMDGFEPWEILYAARKKLKQRVMEQRAAMEQEQTAQTVEDYNLHITSEVKVK